MSYITFMSLAHAILGFLAIRSMTGYELNKAFASSATHFWAADQSQLYRTLHRAEADGLVTSDVIEQVSRPDRRVYSLLNPGREALAAWLRSPLEPENAVTTQLPETRPPVGAIRPIGQAARADAWTGAAILTLIAPFHLALVFGAPLGAYTQGGSNHGALPALGRVVAGVPAMVVLFMASVLLARVERSPLRPASPRLVAVLG